LSENAQIVSDYSESQGLFGKPQKNGWRKELLPFLGQLEMQYRSEMDRLHYYWEGLSDDMPSFISVMNTFTPQMLETIKEFKNWQLIAVPPAHLSDLISGFKGAKNKFTSIQITADDPDDLEK